MNEKDKKTEELATKPLDSIIELSNVAQKALNDFAEFEHIRHRLEIIQDHIRFITDFVGLTKHSDI